MKGFLLVIHGNFIPFLKNLLRINDRQKCPGFTYFRRRFWARLGTVEILKNRNEGFFVDVFHLCGSFKLEPIVI